MARGPRPATLQSRTCSDTEPGHEVVQNGPDGRLPVQRRPESHDAAHHGKKDDEGDVEPVDVLVPVGPGQGSLGDVRLGAILSWPPASRRRLAGHVGQWLRSESRRTRHCLTGAVGERPTKLEEQAVVDCGGGNAEEM